MLWITRVSSKGQVTIPKPLRERLELKPGSQVAFVVRDDRVELEPMTRIDVKLRQVHPERNAASYQVVFDRFDPGEGVFVRHTLTLEQTDSLWKKEPLIGRDGSETLQTPAFRDIMTRLARDESELMFLVLGKRKGIRVTEVTRGRIGPLWSPWAPAPESWMPEESQSIVLHCPLDTASVDRQEDTDDDPFTAFFSTFLSPHSRPLLEESARELGYRVHKERSFACTPEAREPLLARLEKSGEPCRVEALSRP